MVMSSRTTNDGYSWTPDNGTRKGGFKCKGVITPSRKLKSLPGKHHDAIVIGAGYAGLAAARDLATSSEFAQSQTGNNADDVP